MFFPTCLIVVSFLFFLVHFISRPDFILIKGGDDPLGAAEAALVCVVQAVGHSGFQAEEGEGGRNPLFSFSCTSCKGSVAFSG